MPEFHYTPASVAIDQLRFDPSNPRLPSDVDAEDVQSVLRFMLDDAGLIDLASSIAAQGFFPGEPLLCCPVPELDAGQTPPPPTASAEYIVVEGNRRLAAVLLLRDPANAPSRRQAVEALAESPGPETLPVIIFPRRDDILDYLGYRHITGIKEWEPLAKARYLRQVRERKQSANDPAEPRDLARLIGSNGPYVGRLLTALAAWDRLEALGFFDEHDLSSEDLPFAVFSTALNYERIPEWLNVDPTDDATVADAADEHLKRLARWFFVPDERVQRGNRARPLLRESRNIRFINEIVGHEDAMASLEEANSPQLAASLTAAPGETFSRALIESGKYLAVASRRFPAVEHPAEEDENHLTEIRDEATSLHDRVAERRGAATP